MRFKLQIELGKGIESPQIVAALLRQAGERGEFNTDDVISFIESHCQQAVWAVLLGEQYVQRHHPELFDDLNHAT